MQYNVQKCVNGLNSSSSSLYTSIHDTCAMCIRVLAVAARCFDAFVVEAIADATNSEVGEH